MKRVTLLWDACWGWRSNQLNHETLQYLWAWDIHTKVEPVESAAPASPSRRHSHKGRTWAWLRSPLLEAWRVAGTPRGSFRKPAPRETEHGARIHDDAAVTVAVNSRHRVWSLVRLWQRRFLWLGGWGTSWHGESYGGRRRWSGGGGRQRWRRSSCGSWRKRKIKRSRARRPTDCSFIASVLKRERERRTGNWRGEQGKWEDGPCFQLFKKF